MAWSLEEYTRSLRGCQGADLPASEEMLPILARRSECIVLLGGRGSQDSIVSMLLRCEHPIEDPVGDLGVAHLRVEIGVVAAYDAFW